MKRDVRVGDVLSFQREVWSDKGDVDAECLIDNDDQTVRLGVVLHLHEWQFRDNTTYEALVIYEGRVGWIVLGRNIKLVCRP